MNHGPEGAQCEYNINKETNEENRIDNEICEDDAREISNLEQVSVRKKQWGETDGMNHKQ